MKQFLLGLIVGAAVYALGAAAYRHDDSPDMSERTVADDEARTPIGPMPAAPAGPDAPPEKSVSVGNSVFPSKPASPGKSAANGCPKAREPTTTECFAMFAREQKQEDERRNAEPKDPTWSYATEQQLRQFISMQPAAERFQVTSADCRTTFCEVRAIGADLEAIETFQKVMGDFREQYGYPGSAGGSESDGTRVTMFSRLMKPETPFPGHEDEE